MDWLFSNVFLNSFDVFHPIIPILVTAIHRCLDRFLAKSSSFSDADKTSSWGWYSMHISSIFLMLSMYSYRYIHMLIWHTLDIPYCCFYLIGFALKKKAYKRSWNHVGLLGIEKHNCGAKHIVAYHLLAFYS